MFAILFCLRAKGGSGRTIALSCVEKNVDGGKRSYRPSKCDFLRERPILRKLNIAKCAEPSRGIREKKEEGRGPFLSSRKERGSNANIPIISPTIIKKT